MGQVLKKFLVSSFELNGDYKTGFQLEIRNLKLEIICFVLKNTLDKSLRLLYYPISFCLQRLKEFCIFNRRNFSTMKTFMERPQDVKRKWYIVDAKDQVLGRLATRVADKLRGKKKATFTPNVDGGDYVIVINADKVRLTGKKADKKLYQSHSFYPGGFSEEKFSSMVQRNPVKVITLAVRGMVPKSRLGNKIMTKLRVYKGDKHPHTEVKPEAL